jgi:hypothetical protein
MRVIDYKFRYSEEYRYVGLGFLLSRSKYMFYLEHLYEFTSIFIKKMDDILFSHKCLIGEK